MDTYYYDILPFVSLKYDLQMHSFLKIKIRYMVWINRNIIFILKLRIWITFWFQISLISLY
jgi:hypothetical protein